LIVSPKKHMATMNHRRRLRGLAVAVAACRGLPAGARADEVPARVLSIPVAMASSLLESA
jgi:hypothetical protein